MSKSDHTTTEAAADDDDVFSAISCLSENIVLEIFKKLMDLKTLCVCKAVSKRFYAIVRQVDTVCYNSPFSYTNTTNEFFECGWLKSISKFERVKSLCIQIPSSFNMSNSGYFFKWKFKVGFNGVRSFVFLSASSVYDNNNRLLLYEDKQNVDKFSAASICLMEASMNLKLVKLITIKTNIPLLEKVSIMDPDNRGKVYVNGRENIDEFIIFNLVSWLRRVNECHIPLLELPVSGYVMKGLTLYLAEESSDVSDDGNYDSFFLNDEIDIKHDKEDATYQEAMMEISKKHKGSIARRLPKSLGGVWDCVM